MSEVWAWKSTPRSLAEFTGKIHGKEDMTNLLEPKGPWGFIWPGSGWPWAPDIEWFLCCGLGRHVKMKLRKSVLYDTFLMWGEHMQRFACIINSFLVTLCRFSGYFADVNSQFSLHLCIYFSNRWLGIHKERRWLVWDHQVSAVGRADRQINPAHPLPSQSTPTLYLPWQLPFIVPEDNENSNADEGKRNSFNPVFSQHLIPNLCCWISSTLVI